MGKNSHVHETLPKTHIFTKKYIARANATVPIIRTNNGYQSLINEAKGVSVIWILRTMSR
jgi:hypothetical protein